ncbi:aspartate aminotransferase family protein [Bacillus coahuilensis]
MELKKLDEELVFHSFRPYNPNQTMLIEEAKGVYIFDSKGEKYLDGMAGLWCVNVGYGRDELAEAAYKQLKKMPYYPLTHTHETVIKLAEKLTSWLEDDYVYIFSNSGSEANETAFKLAKQFHDQNGDHHRHKIISRYRGYHGNTFGALAATGQAQRKFKYEPLGSNFIHIPPPDSYRAPQVDTVEYLDQIMTWELSETISAFIMEPIITGGGILMPPEDYLSRVEQVCKKHGALLIIDEVICGFGRTGKKFGFQHEHVRPDIVTMAKGLTSGYLPLSVTAIKRDIFEKFKGQEKYDYFRHINTFGGNPAACAVALENLSIMENENLVEKSAILGREALAILTTNLSEIRIVGDIRGKGLLIGIEMVEDQTTKKPVTEEVLNKIVNYCKNENVLIGKNGATVNGFNNIIALSPPLIISRDELHHLLDTVIDAIKNVVE